MYDDVICECPPLCLADLTEEAGARQTSVHECQEVDGRCGKSNSVAWAVGRGVGNLGPCGDVGDGEVVDETELRTGRI